MKKCNMLVAVLLMVFCMLTACDDEKKTSEKVKPTQTPSAQVSMAPSGVILDENQEDEMEEKPERLEAPVDGGTLGEQEADDGAINDLFCQYLRIDKDDIKLTLTRAIPNESDSFMSYLYDVYVTGKPKQSGEYIAESGYNNYTLWKKAEAREADELGWQCTVSDYTLYHQLKEIEPQRIADDSCKKVELGKSKIQKYRGQKCQYPQSITGATTEDGYMNQDGEYEISYINYDNKWVKRTYTNGTWENTNTNVKCKNKEHTYKGTSDGMLWESSDDTIIIYDASGKKQVETKPFAWLEGLGYGTVERDYTMLTKYRMAVNVSKGNESRENGLIVDLKNEKVLLALSDKASKHLYEYENSWYGYQPETKQILIYNGKTGQLEKNYSIEDCVNHRDFDDYRMMVTPNDFGYEVGLRQIYPNCVHLAGPITGLRHSFYNGEFYFANRDGVYRFNSEDGGLSKILLANKQKGYRLMTGDFQVGKNGRIYLFGNYVDKKTAEIYDEFMATDFWILQ